MTGSSNPANCFIVEFRTPKNFRRYACDTRVKAGSYLRRMWPHVDDQPSIHHPSGLVERWEASESLPDGVLVDPLLAECPTCMEAAGSPCTSAVRSYSPGQPRDAVKPHKGRIHKAEEVLVRSLLTKDKSPDIASRFTVSGTDHHGATFGYSSFRADAFFRVDPLEEIWIQHCLPQDANVVSGCGVTGCLVPIEDVRFDGTVDWSPDLILEHRCKYREKVWKHQNNIDNRLMTLFHLAPAKGRLITRFR